MTAASQQAQDAGERAATSKPARGLARLGIVSKAALYFLVAFIALQVALTDGGRLQDRQGAIRSLADEPLGGVALIALAIGLAGYALWRFAQAVRGRNLETGEKEGFFTRVGYAARGLLYAGTCVLTVSYLLGGSGGGSGGGGEEDTATARVLDLPFGVVLVYAVGAAIVGAGLYNIWRAIGLRFMKNLKTGQMSPGEERTYKWIGVLGHLARGLVFGLIGVFLMRAAYLHNANEAVGIDGALSKVLQQPFGPWLLGFVAVGLVAYGVFSLVQARYRVV